MAGPKATSIRCEKAIRREPCAHEGAKESQRARVEPVWHLLQGRAGSQRGRCFFDEGKHDPEQHGGGFGWRVPQQQVPEMEHHRGLRRVHEQLHEPVGGGGTC